MRPIQSLLVVSLVVFPPLLPFVLPALLSTPADAQEKYDTAPLPAVCTTAGKTAGKTASMPAPAASHGMMANMPVQDLPAGGMAMPGDAAHKALAAGMAKMRADMAVGMQAPDIDIAFNCGMIPHHQGAIAMARVELEYGKDPANRKLAQEIIKAQEAEVMSMLAWLDHHAK
jgi:uncharacterized protein (DUF305 family)